MASEDQQDLNVQDVHSRRPGPVALTEEEIAVLKDCRRQSLYYRGLPLGAISVLITRQIAHSGYFPRVARWSGMYYSGAFMLGVLSGVASYRKVCMEKIMKLENSVLADQFRELQERRSSTMAGRRAPQRGVSVPPSGDQQMPRDAPYSAADEVDMPLSDASGRGRSELSYEELRGRHRQSQQSAQSSADRSDQLSGAHRSRGSPDRSYSPPDNGSRSPISPPYHVSADEFQNEMELSSVESPPQDDGQRKTGFKRTNQYGDPID